ncbi:MAG: hypothetical protein Q8T03_07045 [Bacteroidota bacterium]|nr:hypothetical protein [Bacteroidota bacterium]
MKNHFLFLKLFFSIYCIGQNDTTFFNANWKVCNKNVAEYYRIIEPHGTNFLVKDYYKNNFIQMEAICSKEDTLIKNGKCTFFDEQGRITNQGSYCNNIEIGIWVIRDYYKNGKLLSLGYTKNNQWDSVSTNYYESGNIYSTFTYNKDTLHGEAKFYREDGTIRTSSNYLNGELDGWNIQFNKKGGKSYEEEYKNGKSTKSKKLYFGNGQVQGEIIWTEWRINGYKIWYYENGQIQSKVIFVNGKRKKIVRSGRVLE